MARECLHNPTLLALVQDLEHFGRALRRLGPDVPVLTTQAALAASTTPFAIVSASIHTPRARKIPIFRPLELRDGSHSLDNGRDAVDNDALDHRLTESTYQRLARFGSLVLRLRDEVRVQLACVPLLLATDKCCNLRASAVAQLSKR